jgi:hypothetical protein
VPHEYLGLERRQEGNARRAKHDLQGVRLVVRRKL